MESPEPNREHRRFERESLLVLGIFFIVFGVLVLLGILWEKRGHAQVVSAGAGALLFLIGSAMLAFARRLRNR